VAGLLGLLVAAAAVRAVVLDREAAPPPGGLFGVASAARAEGVLQRLAVGLLSLQGEDGAFDPYPDDPGQPEIRRTASHALAAAALARAASLGFAGRVPGLVDGRDAALRVLAERQQPGGTFGSMPAGVRNPWPGVDATTAAILAFAYAPEGPSAVLQGAVGALARASAYKLRDGWTRAEAAIALDTLARVGREDLFPGPISDLVRYDPGADRVDCTDYRLAEAICRVVLGRADPYGPTILRACREAPPEWTGETSDLQSWYLQAWLAARTPGGAAWFAEALPALEEAERSPPAGRIPDGWYADGVAQTACAILCLAEGLSGRPAPSGGG
jgi:hypothetical protein